MLASHQSDPFCEYVIARLTAAGWITNHTFRAGSGYVLGWTVGGGQRILLLREIADIHGVTAPSAKAFTVACKAGEGSIPEPVARFWLECVRELELGMEYNTLGTFVNAIHSAEDLLRDAS